MTQRVLRIEDQAFSPSYDLVLPLSRQQVFSLSQSSCVSPVELIDIRGGVWDGAGAKSYDDEKAWPSINLSIFSGTAQTGTHFLRNPYTFTTYMIYLLSSIFHIYMRHLFSMCS
jgi:hypothetical protein